MAENAKASRVATPARSARTLHRRGGAGGIPLIRVLLVAPDGVERASLANRLAACGDFIADLQVANVVEARMRLGALDELFEVIVVRVADENDEPALGLIRGQSTLKIRPSLVAIVRTQRPELKRAALAAGADELLLMPVTRESASRGLLAAAQAYRRRIRGDGGEVLAFASNTPGSGVTTVSASVALALRYRLGRNVAVVDLQLQNDGLATFLYVQPERTILNLGQLGRAPDSFDLASVLVRHESGVQVLAGPGRIAPQQAISTAALNGIIALLRELFDVAVLDCGSCITSLAVAAWEQSDELLYVIDQSTAAACSAWRFLKLLERRDWAVPEPLLVLNRYSRSHEASEESIRAAIAAWEFIEALERAAHRGASTDDGLAERVAARPFYAKVPSDERSLEAMLLSGKDLYRARPGGALARAIEQLARRLSPDAAGAATQARHRTGVVSRLLSRISATAHAA